MEGGTRLVIIISKDATTLKFGEMKNNGSNSSVGCG
jgi:hypothetical protein